MPSTILSRRVETFRDLFNTSSPIRMDGAAGASVTDIKLLQYLLRCWAASGTYPQASWSSSEAARLALRPGFINGRFDEPTRRVLQLFETEFELPGDGNVHPIPTEKSLFDPFLLFRNKLGLLNACFQSEINRKMGGRPLHEIRIRIARTMPADLANTLYPQYAAQRRLATAA